jgi:hypothetical protein
MTAIQYEEQRLFFIKKDKELFAAIMKQLEISLAKTEVDNEA